MSVGSAALSTVSELVKQSSLINSQQFSTAQEGLKFAQTALKTSKLNFNSQETKLRQSVDQGTLSQEDFSRKFDELRRQSEIDCAPWEIYVNKLTNLIEKYSSEQKKTKRDVEVMLPVKRTRITFPSDSSESEDEQPVKLVAVEKKKHDQSTNTDPLEFSLRVTFPPTPSILPFTAQTTRRIRRIPIEQLNEFAAEQIVRLHEEGQLVRWNDVLWRLFVHYQVEDLGHFGLTRVDQIPCLDHLVRLQTKINTYLDAYGYYHNLGTLAELENDLARLFQKNSYDELFLGPIEKQTKVEELFHLRSNFSSKSIRKDLKSSDVLKYLDQYMTKERSWIAEKDIQMIDFLKYLAEQIGVQHIHQLGVRMKSVYLSRTCIKSMQMNQRKTMEIARNQLNEILADLATNEVQRIRDKLDDQREKHSTMNFIDVFDDLIETCRTICFDYASFRKLTNLFHVINNDSMLRNLFQLALCRGEISTPSIDESQPKKTYFSSSSSEDETTLPTDEEILPLIKNLLDSIDDEPMNFRHLSRIEERLCEKFRLKSFEDFRRGSFVKFLSKHDEFLRRKSTKKIEGRISSDELDEFLHQCKEKTSDRIETENLVKYHFQLEHFEMFEPKDRIIETNVRYECLVVDIPISSPLSSFDIDLTGRILMKFDECPLLSDIELDLQWNRIYRTNFGNLKTFLRRHRCSFLELNCQTLVKISSTSSIDDFRRCLQAKDPIGTAGHFVSILVQSGSIRYAPLNFLCQILDEFLSQKLFDNNDELYRFFARIFLRIPSLIFLNVVQRIFLQTLSKFDENEEKIRDKFSRIFAEFDHDVVRRMEHFGFVQQTKRNNEQQQQQRIESSSSSITTFRSKTIKTEKFVPISTSTSRRDVIERIRREKFGIGLDLSTENEDFAQRLKSLVGRSLERLSKELYNNDFHFILELIQNADDNQYDDETTAALIFILNDESIEIYNNEIGFQEENIEALCDIGKSTKMKHQRGFIGQKGIGFKSVFTVTNRPEIYSNGFQICFDLSNGPIGFILPEWIDEDRRSNEFLHWQTRIRLPIDVERNRKNLFDDIQPSLLLFLNRIRSIQIENRTTKTTKIYQREDLTNSHVVRIRHDENDERWFVMKNNDQIALAFPLHEIQLDGKRNLTKKDLFAFLPLRTFGFTFIIQADFEVPSSRQDLLVDSLWNERILNEIPQFFLSALDEFESEKNVLPIDPLSFFLEFLPHPSTIFGSPILTSLSRRIFHLLKQRRFLPVTNDDELHSPDQCILFVDISIRNYLDVEILSKTLNLFPLDQRFQRYSTNLFELGVQRFNIEHLIEFSRRISNQIELLGRSFALMFRFLNDFSLKDEDEILRRLRSMKILPLKSNRNDDDRTIFFPSEHFLIPKLIENDLPIVDENLWRNFSSESIRLFLERLGVEHLTERTLFERYIYPIFDDKTIYRDKSIELKNEFLRFFFDIWRKRKYSIDFQRLKTSIEFFTNESFRSPIDFPIYFQEKIPSTNWIYLSSNYFRDLSASIDELRQFFRLFDVHEFLLPVHRWSIEQFNELLQQKSTKIQQILFIEIQKYFLRLNENEKNDFVRSTFVEHLRQSKWIPTLCQHRSTFDQPNRIYLKTSTIEKLLGENVPLIDIDETIDSNFAQILGLIDRISSSQLLAHLADWSQSTFSTSISHMSFVYEYLGQTMNLDELRSIFDEFPLIFIPKEFSDRTNVVEGRFIERSRVRWHDASNLFNKYPLGEHSPSTLEKFYNDQQTLFLNIFAVRLHPTIDEYLNLLVHIASLKTNEETIGDAEKLFHQIVEYSLVKNDDEDFRRNFLTGKAIFPTRDQRWISISTEPIYIDDEELAERFSSISPIRLVRKPPTDFVKKFYEICAIPSLTSMIPVDEVPPAPPTTTAKVQMLLADVAEKRQIQLQRRRKQMAENLDELTHQILDGRQSGIGADQQALENIGRQGEIWVNDYLRTKYQNEIETNQMKILWLNENIEQGKPFDFILEDYLLKRTIYVEVKSTISSTRQIVPITFNELRFCSSLSDENCDYVIYRVYNIGKPDRIQLQIVTNIEENLRKHSLELFLLI